MTVYRNDLHQYIENVELNLTGRGEGYPLNLGIDRAKFTMKNKD
jgi:hypothetical protein